MKRTFFIGLSVDQICGKFSEISYPAYKRISVEIDYNEPLGEEDIVKSLSGRKIIFPEYDSDIGQTIFAYMIFDESNKIIYCRELQIFNSLSRNDVCTLAFPDNTALFYKGEFCCKVMEDRIKDETIERNSNDATKEIWYYIHGKPEFANDGDRYFDDMTGSVEIKYCPFCGKDLLKH